MHQVTGAFSSLQVLTVGEFLVDSGRSSNNYQLFKTIMTSSLKLTYMGPSMNPTLKVGDILKVVPYQSSTIRIGDIVVFCPAGEKRPVVHRVVSIVFRGGVKTRGDNNLNIDPYVLTADGIIGRVVSVQRGSINISIHRGRRGSVYANLHLITKRINVIICRILHPAYHWISQKGFLKRILGPLLKTKIIYFKRLGGVEMQILIGR